MSRPGAQRPSAATAALCTALACLVLVACGGSTSHGPPSATSTRSAASRIRRLAADHATPHADAAKGAPAHGTSTINASSAQFRKVLSGFRSCLARHGMKPPPATTTTTTGLGLTAADARSTTSRKAIAACAPVLRAAPSTPSPKRSGLQASRSVAAGAPQGAVATATLKSYAACMRTKGISSFPEPQHGGFNIIRAHIDQATPGYMAAEASCNRILQAGASDG